MAKNDNLTDFLTDVADAIRAKKGTTAKINPQNFSREIASISTGGGDIPVIGDGKTYLYIKITAPGRMTVPLNFSQTVANGVTIDWGDGSETQTSAYTGNVEVTHTYADVGEYTISLNPSSGCTLGLGINFSASCVMGATGNNGRVYCNMLQAVEIGKNVTRITNYAFSSCYSLASVVIPSSVTSIGESAFQNCYSLASIVIPDSVTSIGSYAFSYCYSLASIVIPDSVTSIGNGAFFYCSSLASVVIPDSITRISDQAFSGCYSLANIVIPDSVTSIGSGTFDVCYSLASVVIPSSVTSIGNYAFSGCYGITFCDFRTAKSVPTLGGPSVFNHLDCKIVVPDSLYDTWIAATNWTYVYNIVKASEFNG
jgi:hypothetical protein